MRVVWTLLIAISISVGCALHAYAYERPKFYEGALVGCDVNVTLNAVTPSDENGSAAEDAAHTQSSLDGRLTISALEQAVALGADAHPIGGGQPAEAPAGWPLAGWVDAQNNITNIKVRYDTRTGFSIDLRPGVTNSSLSGFLSRGDTTVHQGETDDELFYLVDTWTSHTINFAVEYGQSVATPCGVLSNVYARAVAYWAYSKMHAADKELLNRIDGYVYSLVGLLRGLVQRESWSPAAVQIFSRSLDAIQADIALRHNGTWMSRVEEIAENTLTAAETYSSNLKTPVDVLGDLHLFTPCANISGCVAREIEGYKKARKAGSDAFFNQEFDYKISVQVKPDNATQTGSRIIMYPVGMCRISHSVVRNSANPERNDDVVARHLGNYMSLSWSLPFSGFSVGGLLPDGTRTWLDAVVLLKLGVIGGPKCSNANAVQPPQSPETSAHGSPPSAPTTPKKNEIGGYGWIFVENDDDYGNYVTIVDRLNNMQTVFQGYINAWETKEVKIAFDKSDYGDVALTIKESAKTYGYPLLRREDTVKGW